MPTRIEFNVITGKSVTLDLTAEEIAAAQAATAAWQAMQTALPLNQTQILQNALLTKGVLVQADITAAAIKT
jgi:hypothetical protein